MSQPYEFLASAEISPITDGKRRLTGIAYAGGIITDHRSYDRVAFDLSSTTLATPIPLLCNHDHDCTIGVITAAIIDSAVRIESELFTGIDADADEVANKADAGMPWQLSVGIYPGEITELSAGTRIVLNGVTVEGPLIVFRNNRIREVSVVALGADSRTTTTVFNLSTHQESPVMASQTESTEAQDHTLQALQEENEQLKNIIAQFHAEQRTAQVKDLFSVLGREYTEASAALYVTFNDEQFAALQADLIANKPASKPDYLFSAQATQGAEINSTDAAKRLFNQVAGA
jgi:hypothetical protein